MKKIFLILLLIVTSFSLAGCFPTRTKLFSLPIKETTYVADIERVEYKDKELTHFSISFIDTKEVNNDYKNYDINMFGDLSFKDIKVLEIILKIGFNNEEAERYDIEFLGQANPGRSNAYRLAATGLENLKLVFDMEKPRNKFFGIVDYFSVTIRDFENHEVLSDFDVTDINLKDNDLKSKTFSTVYENRNNVFSLADNFDANSHVLVDKYEITANLSYFITKDIDEFKEIYLILSGEECLDEDLDGYGFVIVKRIVTRPSNVSAYYKLLYWYNGPYLSYANKDRNETEEEDVIDCYDIVWINEDEFNLIDKFMVIDNTNNYQKHE